MEIILEIVLDSYHNLITPTTRHPFISLSYRAT